jgi:flagellar protein FlaG
MFMKIEKEHFPFSLPVKARLSETISTLPIQINVDHTKLKNVEVLKETAEDFTSGINQAKLQEIIEKLNQIVDLYNKQIHFKVHKEAQQLMVQVMDKESNKIIAEYPPKELLDLAVRIKEVIGLFVDKKV